MKKKITIQSSQIVITDKQYGKLFLDKIKPKKAGLDIEKIYDLKFFLKKADFNVSDKNGNTALMKLFNFHNNLTVSNIKNSPNLNNTTKTLIKKINKEKDIIDWGHKNNESNSYVYCSLFLKSSKAFEIVFDASGYKNSINNKNTHNKSVFYQACILRTKYEGSKCEYTKIMKFLVNKGADVDTHLGNAYKTPLYEISKKGDVYSAIELLNLGANVNLLDSSNMNPLFNLLKYYSKQPVVQIKNISGKMVEFINLLKLKGYNFTNKDSKKQDVYHYAVKLGDTDILDMLFRNKHNLNNKNNDGETPLFQAVKTALKNSGSNRFEKTIKWLLSHNANVNEQTNSKKTILHLLTEAKKTDLIKEVILFGGNSSIKDCNGYCPKKDIDLLLKKHSNCGDFIMAGSNFVNNSDPYCDI